MKIGLVGLGHVGVVTACILASRGHIVLGVDTDSKVIEGLNSSKIQFSEPGLDNLLNENKIRLSFSTSYEILREVQMVFITVSTPTKGGNIELHYLLDAALSIKNANSECIIVIKSTVTPGTAQDISELTGMTIVSNPEFTREGNALNDTIYPDRIVIGGQLPESEIVAKIWEFTGAPIILTTNENAELIKYASNVFLATKISFINEIANLCENISGADVKVVARGIGLDKRIGNKFLDAGLGYGGPCLSKDALAFSSYAKSKGVRLKIVESAISVNEDRVSHAINFISKGLIGNTQDAKVCLLGISYKSNTDDLRDSQSIKLLEELRLNFKTIYVFDPKSKIDIQGVEFEEEISSCIEKSDIIVIATEWSEFSEISPISAKGKRIFDLRRILEPDQYENYRGIGFGSR